MPSPIPSFAETFGVGTVPLSSYFKKPASSDTRFAPEARALLQQGEQYDREQAALEAEQMAENLLGDAGQMQDQEITQQLRQNPRLFGTQAIRPLTQYMEFRQSTSPQTDLVLGPQLLRTIKDPRHQESFKQRMLEGMSANDAFEQYRRDEYNDQYANDLAEAGIADEELAMLQTPSGLFDPMKVARRVAKAKAEAKVGTGKATPLDEEIEVLSDAVTRTEKAYEAATKEKDKTALKTKLDSYKFRLEQATDEKLGMLRPVPTAAGGVVSPAVGGVRKPSSFLNNALEVSKIPVVNK